MLRVPLTLAITLFLLAGAWGQTVTERLGFTSSSSAVRKEIDEHGPGWFPVPTIDEPDGTEITVSNDFHNADLCVIFRKDLLPQFLPKAIALVRRLGLTKTQIIVSRGRAIGCIDLEFNEYIKGDVFHSSFDMPLGVMIADIKTWNLPRPVGLSVEKGSRTSQVTYLGKLVETPVLSSLKEVPADATVHLEATRHWWGLLAISFFGLFFISLFGFAAYSLIRVAGKKASTDVPVPPKPKTLGEAQALYEKRKVGFKALLPLFMPLIFIAFISNKAPLEDGFEWIPGSFSPVIMTFLFLPMFVFAAALSAIRRRKLSPEKRRPTASGVLGVIGFSFVVLMMVFTTLQLSAPGLFYSIPRQTLRILLLAIVGVGMLCVGLSFSLKSREKQQKPEVLAAGDPDFDAAMEFGKLAGIKVRTVKVTNLPTANAFASLFGTVGLTKGLREKLTLDERRSVIAHEIGHLKAKHVPALVLFSFAILGGIIALQVWMRKHLSSDYSPLISIMGSPLVTIFGITLLRSPFQRRNEHSADRFALNAIGSFDEVAYALAKIHLVNASPYEVRGFEAAISTHPSLKKRLEALRTTALEMGLSVPDDAVDNVIASVRLEEQESAEEAKPEETLPL